MAVTVETLKGVHVKMARALLDMSQRAFGAAVGGPVTDSIIKNLEAGRGYVSDEAKQAIIDAIARADVLLLNGGRDGACWRLPVTKRRHLDELRKSLAHANGNAKK